jgi:hypothetical protein
MAWAFGATQLDGIHTKICTVSCLDNDAAADLAVVFDGGGGRPNVMFTAPVDYYFVRTVSPDTANSLFAITAVAAAGFTIRKLSAGGGANAITLSVVFRTVHTIDR